MASAEFEAVAAEVNNWGRWGADDQLGTLNFIDTQAVTRGARCVVTGEVFALGLPMSEAEGVQAGFIAGRTNPTRSMIVINDPLSPDPAWICSSEDSLTMGIQAATHWDALAHVSYKGTCYNNMAASIVGDDGASSLAISAIASIVSRGVLLDVARAKGKAALDPGEPISADDLEATLDMAQVTLEPGDIVLVRTGQMAALHLPTSPEDPLVHPDRDLIAYTFPSAGLTIDAARFFHRHDIAAVATDTLTGEVFPGEREEDYLPVHLIHLVEMGLLQGQNWVLDPLADACAGDGRWTFLLDATPLPLTGALGSPVNPVAIR